MIKRILLTSLAFLITQLALCQVPATLSYQGLLTDSNGAPLEGNQQVSFKFYTGVGGTNFIAGSARGPITVSTFKGLFSTVIGDGTTNNAPLNFNLGDQEVFIEIILGPNPDGTPVSPKVRLTAVPYAFVANTAKAVDAGGITTGTLSPDRIADGSITGAKLTDGTIGTIDIQDAAVTNAKLATGIDAAKLSGSVAVANGGTGATTVTGAQANLGLTIGTNVQAYDADLDDLADGSLTGSKVGTGINAGNITTGSLALANGGTGASTAAAARTNLGLTLGTDVQAFDADLADLADGTLTGSKVDGTTLTSVSASNITAGTLALANGGTGATTAAIARTNLGLAIGTNVQAFDADLTDLADGTLSGAIISLTGTDFTKLASGTTAQRVTNLEGAIRYNTTEKVMEYYNGTNWYFMVPKVIILKDVKPDATDGGFATAPGSWQKRILNTTEGDLTVLTSPLSSDQFSLAPGEYLIEASSQSVSSLENRLRLYRNGDPLTTSFSLGENAYTEAGGLSIAHLSTRFTISTNTTFEIHHYIRNNPGSGNGLGTHDQLSSTQEIYTIVKITKLR